MEAFSAGVQRERAAVFCNVHVEADVGIGNADVGTLVRIFHEIVDNRIFNLVGNKLRIAEFGAINGGVYSKRSVEIENFVPLNSLHCLVNSFRILGAEVENGLQHSDCRAEAEVGTVHHFLITRERDHAATDLHVVGTEFDEFLCQNFF